MKRVYSTPEAAKAAAMQALRLAYAAAVPMGMGFLHANHGPLPEAELVECVRPIGTKMAVYADYLVGRMMKFRLEVDGCTVEGADGLHQDFQSWCSVYPTYDALLSAAETSLSEGVTP